jgi:acid phosphatase (class A)
MKSRHLTGRWLMPLCFLAAAVTVLAESSFLTQDQVADSRDLLPAPPAYDSVAFQRDIAAYYEGRAWRSTPRGEQAVLDADLRDEHLGALFSEAFGTDLSPISTPITYDLLIRIHRDCDLATHSAKTFYQRTRPFAFFDQPSATPQVEPELRHNGSYPSGHTTLGWALALVLAEIRADRQLAILKRGYDIGQSRVICGMHWQSDVEAGRLIGSALVARLHADAAFQKHLQAAKEEIARRLTPSPESQDH